MWAYGCYSLNKILEQLASRRNDSQYLYIKKTAVYSFLMYICVLNVAMYKITTPQKVFFLTMITSILSPGPISGFSPLICRSFLQQRWTFWNWRRLNWVDPEGKSSVRWSSAWAMSFMTAGGPSERANMTPWTIRTMWVLVKLFVTVFFHITLLCNYQAPKGLWFTALCNWHWQAQPNNKKITIRCYFSAQQYSNWKLAEQSSCQATRKSRY